MPAVANAKFAIARTNNKPLRIGASINVVGQVFNLPGQDAILSSVAALNGAPVLMARERRLARAASPSHVARSPHAGSSVLAGGFRSDTENTLYFLIR